MDPERALRLEQLYHDALERDESERSAFLKTPVAATMLSSTRSNLSSPTIGRPTASSNFAEYPEP
jgi:hypothetical protein